jgi:hypothetical protein
MSDINTPEEYGTTYNREPQQMSKAETAAFLGFVVTAVVGFVAFVRYDLKEQKKAELANKEKERERQAARDEFNAWVDSQPANGKIVHKPQVGTYIAIPVDAYKDIEIKRLPGINY